jgi:DNA-binding NarL/FixJ family response regulator
MNLLESNSYWIKIMITRLREIRVLIAEPHLSVRASLSILMSAFEEIYKVGEVASGVEAIELCGELQPNVIVLGASFADMAGSEVARIIAQKPKPPFIIMLGGPLDEIYERAALEAGVNVYFTAKARGYDIIDAIQASPR